MVKKDFKFPILLGFNFIILIGIWWPKERKPQFDWKKLGTELESYNIHEGAAKALSKAFWENPSKNLAFKISTLWEEEGNFEKALYWLGKGQQLSGTSELVKKEKERVVTLLEKLKQYSAARWALEKQTSLNESKSNPVVAEIEGQKILLSTFNSQFEKLNPRLKQVFKGKDGKKKYFQQFIAEELIYTRAIRQKILERNEVRKDFESIKRQFLVQSFLEKEVFKNLSGEENDIKNYYFANKEKYSYPRKIELLAFSVKNNKEGKSLVKDLQKGPLDKILSEKSPLGKFEIKENEKKWGINWVKKLFKKKSFSPYGPFAFEGNHYVTLLLNKWEAQKGDYKNVREQVSQDYLVEKRQWKTQEFMQELLKDNAVKTYVENIL